MIIWLFNTKLNLLVQNIHFLSPYIYVSVYSCKDEFIHKHLKGAQFSNIYSLH